MFKELFEEELNEAVSQEKKEMKKLMSQVQKAEAKAKKALRELQDVYDSANDDFAENFGWQSAPTDNQGHIIGELLDTMDEKMSFYTRKFGEMK